jgi:transcriptional regulator with XRE-family HTH domain
MLQREVATILGATPASYLHWESDEAEPFVRYYPKIIEFLGYAPWAEATSLGERLLQFRRQHGWSIRQASTAMNVDQGTWGRWEKGNLPKYARHENVVHCLTTRRNTLAVTK